MSFSYLTRISSAFQHIDDIQTAKDFANSLSETQHQNKSWLVQELLKVKLPPNPSILILGGWYGSMLVPLLHYNIKPEKIILTDKNERAITIATDLHQKQSNVVCMVLDVETTKQTFPVDIVINTSFEHMTKPGLHLAPFERTVFAIQSCDNKNDPGHINTVESTQDLVEKTGLTQHLYSGKLIQGHKNRFMVIGRR